ncbi:hypothetical protein Trydic_g17261 [Trypoxylus dichotomus]
MKFGVPQGSLLGPVLFTIYIKHIPKLQDHRVFNAIYADNTAIVAISRHSKIAIAFSRTYQEAALDLSVPEQKITVARTEVEWTGQIEYLGIIVDKRLTFSEHLKRTRTRAIGRLFQLYTLLSNPALNPNAGIILLKPLPGVSTPRPSKKGASRAESPSRRRRSSEVPRQAEQGIL